MLERNILIVDDNTRIKSVYIPAYSAEIDSLKNQSEKWKAYSFHLEHCPSMKEAIEYLSDKHNLVDVLVVDYDFNGETTFTNGTAFVSYVREEINRYCQIVFYTMQGTSNIEKSELIDLVNSDVFQLVDKSEDPSKMAQILFRAATMRNPIVESLEQFFRKYSSLLETYHYNIGGKSESFDEIINHIPMDDSEGRAFIEKMMQKAILLNTDI